MNKEAEEKLIKTLESIGEYIISSHPNVVEQMDSYDQTLKTSSLDEAFFLTPLNTSKALQVALNQLLKSAGVPERELGRYRQAPLSVYELLTELYERPKKDNANNDVAITQAKIKNLIDTLDEKYKKRYEKTFLGALLALLGIVATEPFGGISVLQQLLTATLFLPVVQLSIAASLGFYKIYQNISNKSIPFFDKIRDNFFIMASVALKISAYSLVLAAACTSTPIVSILTVVAQGVSILEESFKLLQLKIQGKKAPERTGKETLEVKQAQTRLDSNYEKHKRSLWINLATALMMTAIVAAWCFVPGGIFVAMGAATMMGATYYAQFKANKYNEKITRDDLKDKFDEIEHPEIAPETSTCMITRAIGLKFDVSNSLINAETLRSPLIPADEEEHSQSPSPSPDSADQREAGQDSLSGVYLGF